MERYAWRGRVREGCIEEYKRRHAEIWPEMKAVLKEAGICNYTIFASGNELFGYYECEKGVDYAVRYQNGNEVVQKWEEHMKDILFFENTGEGEAQPKLIEVFRLD